jgi:glycosyltransferase involved in cell wall biosynthesis
VRVLHLNAGNLFGGIETYLLTLARCRDLAPEMESHFGLCFPGRLRDELVAECVPVNDLGAVRLSRPWTVLAARRRLRSMLRAAAFDVVVTHGCWPHVVFAPAVRKAGVRLLNAVHGDLSLPNRIDRRGARTPPDLVIANSRFTAGPARNLFAGSPVTVVYPPVSGPEGRVDRERIRAELGAGPDTVAVLTVSRIEELKGHTVLLEALGRLRGLPEWVSWVVGAAERPHEVELMDRLRAQSARLGIADRVQFLGARSDVPHLMAVADLYCQPNTGPEGFGLTFVEALHAGLPVVTTAFGGAAEIVDETCGVLTPPGDAAAVTTALASLISNMGRRRTLGVGGPLRAQRLCNPATQMKRIEQCSAGGAQWVPELSNCCSSQY